MIGKIDIEDALAGTVFVLSAAVTLGIAGGQTYYGYDIGSTVWTFQGTAITMAFLLTVGALVAAYVTNRKDSGKSPNIDTDLANLARGQASMESYVLLATIVVVIAVGLNLLGFRDIVQGSYIIGTVMLILESAGYYVISYLG